MFMPMSLWLTAFALTVVVEVPLVLYLLRRSPVEPVRLAALVVYANLATHPIVWFVLSQLLLVGTIPYVVAAEAWAIAVEGVFYRVTVSDLTWPRAMAVAGISNAASFTAGRAIGLLVPDLIG